MNEGMCQRKGGKREKKRIKKKKKRKRKEIEEKKEKKTFNKLEGVHSSGNTFPQKSGSLISTLLPVVGWKTALEKVEFPKTPFPSFSPVLWGRGRGEVRKKGGGGGGEKKEGER